MSKKSSKYLDRKKLKWGGENTSTRKRKRPVSKKKQAHNVKMSKQDMEAYRDIANKNYQGKISPVNKV